MSTFHPFPRLPLELREQIWKDTIEPRTVDVRRIRVWSQQYGQLFSSTPIPGTLQSCREARNLGLYERVFFEVAAVERHNCNHAPETAIERFFMPDEQEEEEAKQASQPSTEQRYVWLNLDIDLVDIGKSAFDLFEHIAPTVKRLKFERENSDEYFYHTESKDLLKFVNVEELHIVCADGFWMWSEALDEHAWPCANDKLVFIDAFDGRVARGLEFEVLCKNMVDGALSPDVESSN
jgi:hypothetical protein